MPPATAEVLQRLVALWGLSSLVREAGDFLEDGYFTGQQARAARLLSSGFVLSSAIRSSNACDTGMCDMACCESSLQGTVLSVQ